jgi:hypothetical protein
MSTTKADVSVTMDQGKEINQNWEGTSSMIELLVLVPCSQRASSETADVAKEANRFMADPATNDEVCLCLLMA